MRSSLCVFVRGEGLSPAGTRKMKSSRESVFRIRNDYCFVGLDKGSLFSATYQEFICWLSLGGKDD
jgi:hypothetical protein